MHNYQQAQILEIAGEVGPDLSEDDVSSFQGLFQGSGSYNAVDEMSDNFPEVKYPRTSHKPEVKRISAMPGM